MISNLQKSFSALEPREQKLVAALGIVMLGFFVVVPAFLFGQHLNSLAEENEAMASVIRDIDKSRDKIAARLAEKQAAESRYKRAAPPLGSYVEKKVKDRNNETLSINKVDDQPDKVIGDFTRREIRTKLLDVNLRDAVRLVAEIGSNEYPVAINRLQFDHYKKGETVKLEVGVVTYDRDKTSSNEKDSDKGKD